MMATGNVLAGQNEDILARILQKAKKEDWKGLEIGALMGKVGLEFVGTPYEGGTLEGTGPERCRVILDGLDCVTFFETVFAIAFMINNDQSTLDDLRNRVAFTRYRGGVLNGYTSRLHYTAEWISDNDRKGTIVDVTPQVGGENVKFNVNFMSKHPKYYKPLTDNPSLLKEIAKIEKQINATPRSVIAEKNIRANEKGLMTGDIIAITTSKKGLDYSHTGMILVEDGVARFMHASTTHKKVVVDSSISVYVASVTAHTGISVLRPTGL